MSESGHDLAATTIDRQRLVARHRVVQSELDPRSPLSVGNGEFCFTADLTGLQTFPDRYPVGPRDGQRPDATLLGTYAQWGWHTEPADPQPSLDQTLVSYDSPHGAIPYVDLDGSKNSGSQESTAQAQVWLRANPHRLHLGQLGFIEHDVIKDGDGIPHTSVIGLDEIGETEQHLDLWTTLLTSRFTWRGHRVEVRTVCDPQFDRLAVTIDSPGLADGLAMQLSFPYGNQDWHNGVDWDRPDDHHTSLQPLDDHRWLVERRLDDTVYRLVISGSPGVRVDQRGPHQLLIAATTTTRVGLVIDFLGADTSIPDDSPDPAAVIERAAVASADFWNSGAAVDLSTVDDPRAPELERRIVLSQYLTKINCSGTLPPAETGLVCNSWYGKFHLEMHWWHAAHFPLWGRPELLRRSLDWYTRILPEARKTAARQGIAGARWPKQVGPDGREAPSSIGPFLIWQQPHPIYLAELVRRAEPTDAVVEELAEVVFQTADFMAGYAVETDGRFRLGPPLVPAQESYGGMRARVVDPTFELVYWHWGLTIANQWRDRLGLQPQRHWQRVADHLVPPTVRDGAYAAIGVEPWTIRTDHPSMLCALGVLPQTAMIDTTTMAATLDDVLADWDWNSTWGWDYPVIAMCAARLDRPDQAVDALLMGEHKNTALPNGHNWQTASLPLYLPGNGGLLSAVALMAGGWDGGPEHNTPGFPADWPVRAEGFVTAP